ncbi:hypothetical protein GCM10023195_21440 [Actinoallomurus liliacearum]|uniref:DUF4160 domain-containing protein n=1 Tax=Actinoallomurus liliacearum TaxID=1080073 RepID=A0ABP8TEA3_9ACTN
MIRPEQVYVCLWSHMDREPGHIHFVVQPVTKADMARFEAAGPELQLAMFRAGESPREAEIDAVCARLRPLLADQIQ